MPRWSHSDDLSQVPGQAWHTSIHIRSVHRHLPNHLLHKRDRLRDVPCETNIALLDAVNAGGELFLIHTELAGVYTLRLAIGSRDTQLKHVKFAWDALQACATQVLGKQTLEERDSALPLQVLIEVDTNVMASAAAVALTTAAAAAAICGGQVAAAAAAAGLRGAGMGVGMGASMGASVPVARITSSGVVCLGG